MKRILLVAALSALCPFPAPAAETADEHVSTVQRILARMDRDNDGKVGFEEYRNAMTRRFHAVDKNADGLLQATELPEEWVVVQAADIPSGGLGLESFSEHMRNSFSAFDSNQDGSLDHDELIALAKARAAREEATP